MSESWCGVLIMFIYLQQGLSWRSKQQQCRQLRAHAEPEAEESTSERTELDNGDSDAGVDVPPALTGNSKFASALQAALKRSGDAGVLTAGEPAERKHEPP